MTVAVRNIRFCILISILSHLNGFRFKRQTSRYKRKQTRKKVLGRKLLYLDEFGEFFKN